MTFATDQLDQEVSPSVGPRAAQTRHFTVVCGACQEGIAVVCYGADSSPLEAVNICSG